MNISFCSYLATAEVSLEELLFILRDMLQRLKEMYSELNSDIKKRGIVPNPQSLQAAFMDIVTRCVCTTT